MGKIENFLDWCRKKEINFDGLEIRSAGEGLGNGIFATRFFRREEKCISLPEKHLITAGMVANMQPYSELLDKSPVQLKPFEVLTLFFCLEKSPESEWSPYLEVLPETFSTPAFLELKYDPLDLPLSIRDFYENQVRDLKENFENLQKIVPDLGYKTFVWAWHVVNTRCIYVENKAHPKIDCSEGDTLAVIPFVDMLNHQPVPQCLALHFKVAKTYEVKTCQCFCEGDEIHVSYGPHDNPRLWMEYGFTLPDNIHEKVVITKELFLALAMKADLTVDDAHKKIFFEANLPTTLYKSDEGPGYSFRSNIRILMLTKNQLSQWQDIVYMEHFDDSENADGVHKNPEKEENAIITKMMTELKISLLQKKNKAHADIQWMWENQIDIIDGVMKAVQPT